MPLDPDKLSLITEKAQTLSKRFDAMIERRRANADDDEEEEESEDEDELLEPAAAAVKETPGSDLDNLSLENRFLASPEFDEPWWS